MNPEHLLHTGRRGRYRPLLLAVQLAIASAPVLACGPDFPLRLLDDRGQTLSELPEGNFAFEVSRLGQRIDGLGQATEATLSPYWDDEDERDNGQRQQAESQGLNSNQTALIKQLRQLGSSELDQVLKAELPTELRLYTAAAIAFGQGELASARDYFNQLLALPPAERPLRSTWAAYSLGRTLAALSTEAQPGDSTESAAELRQQAIAAFRLSRQLTIDGFADPLELGIASLGEEARLLLADGDWHTAIALYASQQLHGSTTGYSSLKQLSNRLWQLDEAQLQALLPQPNVARLITASLFARVNWSWGEPPPGFRQQLNRLLLAGDQLQVDGDRLAALSYQYGAYDTARHFLRNAGDSGLAWWLRAKLALQQGDLAAASAAYAHAAKVFPSDEEWGWRRDDNWNWETLNPQCRINGEHAILALERGDYLQAFELLYSSGERYWQDAAEVAERVLTIDELKAFVDARVAAIDESKLPTADSYQPWPVDVRLRELLGRRLLRSERWAEAPAYFATATRRQLATDYGDYRQQGVNNWTALGRAQALYQAATIARQQGMELLGSEMAPDYANLGGWYSLGEAELSPGPWRNAAELQRQQQHLPEPNQRYHYRFTAVRLAEQAATELPARSQAFAAVLCNASGWIEYQDLASAQRLYQRYVAEGPYVPWAANFGHQCQQPEFDAIWPRQWQQFRDDLRRSLRPWKWPLAAAGLGLTALLLMLWRRRRQRQAAVSQD